MFPPYRAVKRRCTLWEGATWSTREAAQYSVLRIAAASITVGMKSHARA